VFDERGARRAARRATAAWEAFCRDVAGSSPAAYRPEARVRVQDLKDGVLRIAPGASPDREGAVELRPDAGDGEIGAAVLRLLREPGSMRPTAAEDADGPATADGPSFGPKIAWLAVRDGSPERVADAIGLSARRPLAWPDGVRAAYEEGVFVAPAGEGWVVAAGVGWLGAEPDVAALSARLGAEVQYFATHRVVEAHAWERAVDGRLVRRVRFSGETGELAREGEATAIEIEIGLAASADEAAEHVDEDTVMRVAGQWSVDPRAFGGAATAAATGLHGLLER
jgi:hypothetical protein